jgi:DNA-binding CsgD family transcriptional regulator
MSECGSIDFFLRAVLDQLGDGLAFDSGIFFVHDGDLDACKWLAWAGSGVGEDFRRGYPQYCQADPFARWLLAHHAAIPEVTTGERLFPYKRFVRSQIYQEFFRPHNVHHILNLNLIGGSGVFGHLCLYRAAHRPGFQPAALRRAAVLAPVLAVATRRVLAECRLDTCERGFESLGRHTGDSAVLLLARDGRALFADAAARRLLARRTVNGDWRAAIAGETGSMLLEHCASLPPGGGASHCELPRARGRPPLSCRIERCDRTGREAFFLIGLGDDRALPAGHAPAPVAALSRREREVAEAVAQGWTNGEVARALSVSVNTVQTHLQSVYRKLQLRNRAELTRRFTAPGRGEDAWLRQ